MRVKNLSIKTQFSILDTRKERINFETQIHF